MNTKPILAYDCACVGGSVALMLRDQITTRSIGQTAQAAELIPAIDSLMRAAGVAYGELGAIVTTVGPGSFTGVRIGLAALHGLVLAHHTPIKTLTTLEAMAWAVAQKANAPDTFYVAIRAGKGEIYVQKFTTNTVIPAQAGVSPTTNTNPTRDSRLRGNDAFSFLSPNAITDITLAPETRADWNAPCFGNQLDSADAHYLHGPDAAILCAIAVQVPATALGAALPLYIRPPDAIAPAPHAWLSAN